MTLINLARQSTPKQAPVLVDQLLIDTCYPFELDPHTVTEFYPWELPSEIPEDFTLGLIIGASGSGKSTLLEAFGEVLVPEWYPDYGVASHFVTAENAIARLTAVGLNSVPAWKQPYHTLSNGQKFRADMARLLGTDRVVDEFTSVVDRYVAASVAKGMRNYIKREGVERMVFASCHRDIIDWLDPDWIIDTDAGTLTVGNTATAPRWYADFIRGDGAVGHVDLS